MSFRKIVLGTAAMSSANVLRLLGQFLVIPIISRLLSPADYGVVAIAMPFILFTMMFADAGVGRSLVHILLIPTVAALTCVGMYWKINHAMELAEWSQLVLAATLALVGIGVGAFTQRRLLVTEINLCQQAFAS